MFIEKAEGIIIKIFPKKEVNDNMTICIATMCENKYVVVATDRMLTVTLPNIEFETDYAKATEVTKNCIAATAGSAIAYTPLFRDAGIEIAKEGTKDIDKIVELTRNSYVKIRNKKIEEEILCPIGLNLQNFYQANQALQPQLVATLVQSMQRYNYQLWILIAGVDEKGPHIYRIENPGRTLNYDTIGYHAIGSGELHAISTFIAGGYGLKATLQRALAITYEAKKRSEKAQGVGVQTDMYVVSKDKVTHLPDNAIIELDSMYQKRLEEEKKIVSDVEDMISKLDIDKLLTST